MLLDQKSVEPWLRPHIEAIEASVRAGFGFRYLPAFPRMLAIQGFRRRSGAMDMYMTHGHDSALAARFRLEDLDKPNPSALWHRHGDVAEVVNELLELPEHGTFGTPVLARALISDLWVPPNTRG